METSEGITSIQSFLLLQAGEEVVSRNGAKLWVRFKFC